MKEDTMTTGFNEATESDVTVTDKQFNDVNEDSTIKAVLLESGNSVTNGVAGPKERISFWKKLKLWPKDIKHKMALTYSKRNPIVNALLSLFLFVTVIISVSILIFGILVIYETFGIPLHPILYQAWSFGIAWTYYSIFCIYYMCRFIGGNHKNAIIPAFIGATLVWFVILIFYVMLTTPDSELQDEEGNDSPSNYIILIVMPLIMSIVVNALSFCTIYLIMKIKKYGASAWTLLDIRRGGRTRLEKYSFILFFVVSIFPVGAVAYDIYIVNQLNNENQLNNNSAVEVNSENVFPTHSSAKIGDYYYQDGTITSEFLPDKEPVGVVFSLETSDEEKQMGYTHGQILCMTDISSKKMPWDIYAEDYERYPNYVWENRMKALDDINGYHYTEYADFEYLTINWDAINYKRLETDGISEWYVPTAGQWARILENLGKVKIDNMLRFDVETATQNLEKYNIDPQRWYWTITEFDAENAWSIRLANGEFGSRSNKQNGAYVRPVASF